MEEDAEEATPAADHDMEPGEQPVPKKQKVSGRTDPSAQKVRCNTNFWIVSASALQYGGQQTLLS